MLAPAPTEAEIAAESYLDAWRSRKTSSYLQEIPRYKVSGDNIRIFNDAFDITVDVEEIRLMTANIRALPQR
jgi:hypothetical protein